jgi:hypothetical protein
MKGLGNKMGRDTEMFVTEEGEIWHRCEKEKKMRLRKKGTEENRISLL